MKKFFGEFKEFIQRGNVLDMAVGVIIATAFGAITSSLINDVLMPFISWLIGAQDMSALNVTLAGEGETAIVLGFGTLVGAIINFILVAFVVFCIVKAFNKAREAAEKKKEEPAPEPEKEPEPSNEEKLLAEIRDLLKNK